ncbi:MAG: type II toxin-antitoxin system prevent-host-death family antitoxin [Pseudomonadales bacterium]
MEATTKDLRLHTKELISATDRGEQVIITYHGKPRAVLAPYVDSNQVNAEQHNPAFGLWADKKHKQTVAQQVRYARTPRSFD